MRRAARGERNHNPGNIDRTTPRTPWQGRVPDDALTDPRFEQFTAAEWGIRALARTLITYQDKHGFRTIAGIISRWAPPNGRDPATGLAYTQNTLAYIEAVSRAVGVDSNHRINVHDYATARPLVESIIKHELGYQPYSGELIDHGLLLAGIQPPARPLLGTKTGAGAAATTAGVALEAAAPLLTDAGSQLHSTGLPWLQIAATVLTVAGIALVLWGRLSVRERAGV
jgi:hypothetical protein